MRYSESIFLKYSLTIIIVLVTYFFLSAQNPLDIKSRLDRSEIQNEDNSSSLINNQTQQSINPFDVKKEPKSQISKPAIAEEVKQNVNKPIAGLSKPVKIVILLVSIAFFVLTRNISIKGFNQIGQSFISSTKMVEYKNSVNGLFNTQITLFYLFFILNAAYFLYLSSQKLNLGLLEFYFSPFIYILLIVAGIYIVKYVVLFVIEIALSIRRAVGNHLFSISIHNILLGMGLFFINIFYSFTEGGVSTIFMYIGFILIGGIYLIRQLKGLQYLSEMRHFSFFHFFIYLCSCEISPLLIGVKMITG